MPKYRIVYIDDSQANLEVFKIILSAHDIEVIPFDNPFDFLRSQESLEFEAILIDVFMPLIGGIALYKQVIDNENVARKPVIFISGVICQKSRAEAYSCGASDFIDRFTDIEEIGIRIKNKIDLYQRFLPQEKFGNLVINLEKISVSIANRSIPVTFIELKILLKVIRSPKVVSKSELIESIWTKDSRPTDSTFLTHIKNLTDKLHDWDHEIRSVKKIGYEIAVKDVSFAKIPDTVYS